MKKIETARQRAEKVRELCGHINRLCSKTSDSEELHWVVRSLEEAIIDYESYKIPWDSKVIDVVIKFDGQSRKSKNDPWKDGVLIKAQQISTDDSVMDRARDVFVFVTLGSDA